MAKLEECEKKERLRNVSQRGDGHKSGRGKGPGTCQTFGVEKRHRPKAYIYKHKEIEV